MAQMPDPLLMGRYIDVGRVSHEPWSVISCGVDIRDKCKKKDEVVERKDAEESAHIELAGIMLRRSLVRVNKVPAVYENGRYKEAAEDKEQADAKKTKINLTES